MSFISKFNKIRKVGSFFKKSQEPQRPTKEAVSPGYAPIGVGGGIGGSGILKGIIIVLLLIGAGVGGYFFFVYINGATGAGQAASGPLFNIQYNLNKFISSFGARSMWWQITHPFEVQPTQAKEEQTNSKYQFLKSLKEDFSVKVDVAPPLLQYGQDGMARVMIQNLGTQDMKKYYILVLPFPGNEIINCMGDSIKDVTISPSLSNGPKLNCSVPTGPVANTFYDKDLCGAYKKEYNDSFSIFESRETIIPGESKVYTLSNIYVNTSCGAGKKANVPQSYPFIVRVITPYVAASRIPVTFISKDYQNLLFTQGLYKQYKVPATAMAGTAVKINIDAGVQPLSNDTTLLPILFNFENKGSGKILGNPLMFLVIPSNFGSCSENYYACYNEKYLDELYKENKGEYENTMLSLKLLSSVICGGDFLGEKTQGVIDNLGGFAAKEMNWTCDKMNQIYYASACKNLGENCNKYNGESIDYNICITVPKHEFQAYSCTLTPHISMHGERRVTYYITAFAVYDYENEAPGVFKVYKMGT